MLHMIIKSWSQNIFVHILCVYFGSRKYWINICPAALCAINHIIYRCFDLEAPRLPIPRKYHSCQVPKNIFVFHISLTCYERLQNFLAHRAGLDLINLYLHMWWWPAIENNYTRIRHERHILLSHICADCTNIYRKFYMHIFIWCWSAITFLMLFFTPKYNNFPYVDDESAHQSGAKNTSYIFLNTFHLHVVRKYIKE